MNVKIKKTGLKFSTGSNLIVREGKWNHITKHRNTPVIFKVQKELL